MRLLSVRDTLSVLKHYGRLLHGAPSPGYLRGTVERAATGGVTGGVASSGPKLGLWITAADPQACREDTAVEQRDGQRARNTPCVSTGVPSGGVLLLPS